MSKFEFLGDEPLYEIALSQMSRKKIIKAIAKLGGTAKFSEIANESGIRDNNLHHHLNVLVNYQIIRQIAGGPYSLKYLTPLGFLFTDQFQSKNRVVYFGLLGIKKNDGEVSEYKVAIDLLKREGIEIDLSFVLSSAQGAVSWSEDVLNVNWILLDNRYITDIDRIVQKIEPVLLDMIGNHIVIIDCTAFNKPATIAMYKLAQRYLIPLIYVDGSGYRLKWLISRNDLMKRFRI